MRRHSIVLLAMSLLALAPRLEAQQTGDAAARLHVLFDEAWQFDLRESPLFATSVGQHAYDDQLPSVTAADLDRRTQFRRALLDRLGAIDRAALGEQDRPSYDMFERELRDAIADFEFGAHWIPITSETGFHTGFASLPRSMPFRTVRQYENYIARLRAFPTYVRQQIGMMRRGLEHGFTQPRVVLGGLEPSIAAHVVDDPTTSVFYAPFEHFASSIPEVERDRLRADGRAAITEAVVPGYSALQEFMRHEYIPNARETVGISEVPHGRAYYEHLVRHFTTVDITPEQVHALGLDEVRRIRAEMEAIIEGLGFDGSFAEFLEFLRTDPRFYAETPEELLKEASFIAKRMNARLPSLFGRLPRLTYGVAPVPDHLAPNYTGGRYVGAPAGSSEPGYYWVNTHGLENRPLYTLPALTLHEAVPGHHLQIALANEIEDLPDFRRYGYVNAFGEGWGLYSEWLGIEAGIYRTPYEQFGRLTYEMWRACRLVVDTGIHAMGWTRRQALDYLASNTALSLHEVRTEIDRYISWPGQALAYKMGELKIRELRSLAEQRLGTRFDVREFHDVVLQNGTVPLTVLEDQVRAYIERLLSDR